MMPDSCSNCKTEDKPFVAAFNTNSNSNSVDGDDEEEDLISIKSAISTIFEHAIQLHQTKEYLDEESDLYMCVDCTNYLADLYNSYLDFMKTTKPTSILGSVVCESNLWNFNNSKSKTDDKYYEEVQYEPLSDPLKDEEEEMNEDEEDELILPNNNNNNEHQQLEEQTTTMTYKERGTAATNFHNFIVKPISTVRSAVVQMNSTTIPTAKPRREMSGGGSYCAVPNCTNNSKSTLLTFHQLPKNSEKRKLAWIKILNLDPSKLFKSTCVCSAHFSSKSYSNKTRLRLKQDALPLPPSKSINNIISSTTATRTNKVVLGNFRGVNTNSQGEKLLHPPRSPSSAPQVPTPITYNSTNKGSSCGNGSGSAETQNLAAVSQKKQTVVNATSSSCRTTPLPMSTLPILPTTSTNYICTSSVRTGTTTISSNPSTLPIFFSYSPLNTTTTPTLFSSIPMPMPIISSSTGCTAMILPSTVRKNNQPLKTNILNPTFKPLKIGRKPLTMEQLREKLRAERSKTVYLDKKLKRFIRQYEPHQLLSKEIH